MKVSTNNCLLNVNPKLAQQWHPTKNGFLKPKDVTPNSQFKAWWICSKNKNHQWEATIKNRHKGRGCPYCAGKAVCDDKCLQSINPILAKEWHPTKNRNLSPRDVLPYSNKKAWWICNKGHQWESTICNRQYGRGCPYCSGKAVSRENSLATINPKLSKEWHPTKNGDLSPRKVTANAGDSVWWICKNGHEWRAKIYHRNKGSGCPYCSSQTSQLELRIYTEIKHLFNEVMHRKKINGSECDIYIPQFKIGIEVDGFYWHGDNYQRDIEKTKALTRNNIILLRVRETGLKQVSENDIFFSNKNSDFSIMRRILCKIIINKNIQKNIKYKLKEYLRIGKLANDDEYSKLLDMLPSPLPECSLEYFNPKLSNEWHPTKNRNLSPRDVTPFANKKAWWICKKNHAWQANISDRSRGNGCPYCAGKAICDDNCLQTIDPKLAKEWHPSKNIFITPKDVSANSGKKVWWICKKGHEWQAFINNRRKGYGCPFCAGKAVCIDNCLQTLSPRLSKEWHPTKNGNLTPRDVRPNSHKKVWWKCPKGHDWITAVSHRSRGSGCPQCYKQKRISSQNVQKTI